MDWLNTLKGWVGGLTELVLMLVGLAIAVSILYSGAGNFFGNTTKNLIDFVKALGEGGLAGLITIGIILWLFSHRKVT